LFSKKRLGQYNGSLNVPKKWFSVLTWSTASPPMLSILVNFIMKSMINLQRITYFMLLIT
jgi:hypothetical protein